MARRRIAGSVCNERKLRFCPTIRATHVGKGTKIDSLVQVGHNVIVGEHCLLCAQAGVAGSTVIGDRVVIGGKAGVADNLIVGDDVVLGGGSVVLSNVPQGRVMMGYPATKMQTHIEGYKALRRLPRTLCVAPTFCLFLNLSEDILYSIE